MSSSTAELMDSSKINGGYRLFNAAEFRMLTNNGFKDEAYESYQTYLKKHRSAWNQPVTKTWLYDPTPAQHLDEMNTECVNTERMNLEWMNTEWRKLEEAWQTSIEKRELDNLSTLLDVGVTFKPSNCMIVVLGLGSLSRKNDRVESMRQHYFVLQLTKNYVNKLQLGFKIPDKKAPWLFLDSSHYGKADREFINKKFDYEGVMRLELISIRRLLGHRLPKTIIQSFIITFKPNNPIRQILADLYLPGDDDDMYDLDIPPLLICAPPNINHSSISPDHWAGDESSTRVQEYMRYYNPGGFESDEWKESGAEHFGHVRFWIAKHLSEGLGLGTPPKDEPDELDQSAALDSGSDWENKFEEAGLTQFCREDDGAA
ncbi:hypothetical protein K505DRAFT_334572 [Melanomma pulvis-pyrius CBS 109.77]|uniref:Uncharacterized protein n=1 Tax=Melanomma pulvis-pyrius CBS 109.77 TaxID=1314802 RepID=A0A6A6XLW6_9PLEO|nr:hypothetical protein K505DRAFT_334572 [Melanomma pulvis-pyrius CBS 109.77]